MSTGVLMHESAYSIDQTVRIRAIDTVAMIVQILFNRHGVQYEVAYWFNGERKSVWVFASELETNRG